MRRTLLKSKIHRATVTVANRHYEGSVTIDRLLLEAADIVVHEKVDIYNLTTGSRLSTYAIEGLAGSGTICINGAAAHGNTPGDLVILATFGEMDTEEARTFEPKVVQVDRSNRMRSIRAEVPGPQMPPRVDDVN